MEETTTIHDNSTVKIRLKEVVEVAEVAEVGVVATETISNVKAITRRAANSSSNTGRRRTAEVALAKGSHLRPKLSLPLLKSKNRRSRKRPQPNRATISRSSRMPCSDSNLPRPNKSRLLQLRLSKL